MNAIVSIADGPASGNSFELARAPLFLRVTHDAAAGTFDALDKLDDSPHDGETITAYRRGETGTVHVDYCRPKRIGWYTTAEYHLIDPQPSAAILCDNSLWKKWAMQKAGKGL